MSLKISATDSLLCALFRICIHVIRIQHVRLNTNPDPDSIRIQGFGDQKFVNLQVKLKIKNCNLHTPHP
jgi:hypothetical protein